MKKSIVKAVTDGWQNLFTGIGILNRDKAKSTNYVGIRALDQVTVTDLYRGDGFGKKIVKLPAREMVREWIEVEGDPDGLAIKRLKDIRAKQAFRKGIEWAMVYGGSVIVMGVDDGGKFEDPVKEDGIKNVEFLRVHDRYEVSWTTADLYDDEENPKYGTPEFYTITSAIVGGVPYKVHETRVLRFDGEDVPNLSRKVNNSWGDSIYQSALERLQAVGVTYMGVENIIDEFVVGLLTIDNLQDMIANGEEDLIIRRLNLLDQSRHIINTMLLDKEEKYEKHSAKVGGLADLLDRFTEALAAVREIPVSLLMGRAQKGLASGGAQTSDVRNWYDKIAGDQENQIEVPLGILIRYIMLSKEGEFKGKEPSDGWMIVFKPLWQPTQSEMAEDRKNQSEADKNYIETNVLTASEVALSRFGGDRYSFETILDESLVREELEPELVEEEEGEEEEGEDG